MRKTASAAVLGLALIASPGAANTINLTFASGYGPGLAWTEEQVNRFLPGVNERLEAAGSPNRVNWTVAIGGTLASMANMLDAMTTGLADVGHVVHVFEPVRLPLQNVPSVAPFATEDPMIATLALHELNLTMPALQKVWDDLGLVYLTSFSFDSYLLVSRTPINAVADLSGRRVAAAAANMPWLEGTGAVGAAATSATIYNDFRAGVFDAGINSAMLASPGRLHEVAPYFVKTGFGPINAFNLVANRASWERLPEDVRAAIQDAADEVQISIVERVTAEAAAALDAMAADGATVTELSEEERRRWVDGMPNIAERWVAEHESRGLPAREVLDAYMASLRAQGAEPLRDWSDF